MKQGKIWGETEEIFNDGKVSVHYLWIKEKGYCSEHQHVGKSNLFYVISGQLEISIWREKGVDKTIIGNGESSFVPPGVYHKFKAIYDTECIEIYETKLDPDDIERRVLGGIANV